jgi:putative transposase
VEQARAEGVDLVGPGGLLGDLTKRVLEAGLEAEMTDHVGYERHDPAGRTSGNSRNGTRTKTVITDVGPVELAVPRDRDGSFEPKLVAKRLRGVDEMVISLTAKGLTTGEVQAHLAEVYGTEVSRETVSKITDRILEEMTEWMTRPLERVYPVVFIDALFVKIRDGQVTNRPIYTAIGGHHRRPTGDPGPVGLWAGTGGAGAKFWLQVLTESTLTNAYGPDPAPPAGLGSSTSQRKHRVRVHQHVPTRRCRLGRPGDKEVATKCQRSSSGTTVCPSLCRIRLFQVKGAG